MHRLAYYPHFNFFVHTIQASAVATKVLVLFTTAVIIVCCYGIWYKAIKDAGALKATKAL